MRVNELLSVDGSPPYVERGKFYPSVPGETPMNCRYSEKKCERKTGNIQKKGMSSGVKLTNLEGRNSFNINKSGHKRKLNMNSR